jgi:hypothetical protein
MAGKLIIVVMGIFVDYLLVTGNSVEEIATIQEKMKSKFVWTDQGELESYLGVKVSKLMRALCSFIRRSMLRKFLKGLK